MKQLYLDALRDIAIEHIPKARKLHSLKGMSHYDVCAWLYTVAFLTFGRPTTSALERAAAQLLQHLMALAIPLDEKLTPQQRMKYERWSIEAAHDLFELEGKEAPAWLPPASPQAPEPDEEATPAAAPQAQATKPQLVRPAPGINLTTAQAASLLNRAEQTLRVWSSKDNGPIRPTSGGTKLAWSSDDVIRLMENGW